MAITFVLGAPGSGKSYYAVSKIIESVSTRIVAGNIKFNDNVDFPNYAYLDHDQFSLLLDQTRVILEDVGSIDKKVALLAEVWHSGLLLVIDEAHLFGFGKRNNDYLRDFFSIHRHLNLDIILITQTVKAIRADLLDLGELFVRVTSASKRLVGNMMEYDLYASADDMRRKDQMMRLGTKRFMARPEIFSLYKSGENLKGSSALRGKLLQYAAMLLLGLGFAGYSSYKLIAKPAVTEQYRNTTKKYVERIEKNATLKKVVPPDLPAPPTVDNIIDRRVDRELICVKKFSNKKPDWRNHNIVTKIKSHYYEICDFI